MKTTEDVKKALACCENADCKACPYDSVGVSIVDCLEALVGDATAYINQLEARGHGWISVKDRLPEPSTYVLALTAPGALSVGQNVIVADYIHPKKEEYGVFIMAYTPYADQYILPVTHWMPLPEMPEEE